MNQLNHIANLLDNIEWGVFKRLYREKSVS